jgi:hypothetical protein
MWKEIAVVYFEVVSWHLLVGSEEKTCKDTCAESGSELRNI